MKIENRGMFTTENTENTEMKFRERHRIQRMTASKQACAESWFYSVRSVNSVVK